MNGWSVTGAALLNSGSPLTLHPQFNNTGGVITGLTVNSVAGIDPTVSDPGPNLWFNPGAFDQPADFTMGNTSRTISTILNPGTHNFDLSVSKRVQIGLERSIEFTEATGFNFLNHGDWNYPDTAIGPASAPNMMRGDYRVTWRPCCPIGTDVQFLTVRYFLNTSLALFLYLSPFVLFSGPPPAGMPSHINVPVWIRSST